jgi:hypothetical protein
MLMFDSSTTSFQQRAVLPLNTEPELPNFLQGSFKF